jgi:hypothetical protein
MHKMDLEESAMKSVGRSERGFAQYGGGQHADTT